MVERIGCACKLSDLFGSRCQTRSGAETEEIIANLSSRSPPPEVDAIKVHGSRGNLDQLESTRFMGLRVPAAQPQTAETFQGIGEEACCLVWSLSIDAQTDVQEVQLAKLHDQIAFCVQLCGAQILMEDATRGLIRGLPVQSSLMTSEDTAVRLGHLLCKWASLERLGLRTGVHVGTLKSMQLKSGDVKVVYFGSAAARAAELAGTAPQEFTVHMSKEVRDRLSALRTIRVGIAPGQQSFYLSPATVVKNYFEGVSKEASSTKQQRRSLGLVNEVAGRRPSLNLGGMGIAQFQEMLTKHGIDVEKFGKGVAKTLDEFYIAVVQEEKCFLVENEGGLERFVTLVRIQLRFVDAENRVRELRLAHEGMATGGTRIRNQPLAIVMRPQEEDWQDAVRSCLANKLQLEPAVQEACLALEMGTYHYKEERNTSETIPGIMTNYRAHSITIEVKDKNSKPLNVIGLPQGEDFTMGLGASTRHWTWAVVKHTKEDELISQLQAYGIDVLEFSPQAFAELYEEVYERGLSKLDTSSGELVRTISVIKVWLHAVILNVDHVLAVKAKFQKGHWDDLDKDRPISMRMKASQEWEDAVQEALNTRLGISRAFQAANMSIDAASHQVTQELGYSRSYEGLKTLYVVNEVAVRINDTKGSWCRSIGLPNGTEFSYERREASAETEDLVLTHWCWKLSSDLAELEAIMIRGTLRQDLGRAAARDIPGMVDGDSNHQPAEDTNEDVPDDEVPERIERRGRRATRNSEAEIFKSRVPCPKPTVVELPDIRKSPVDALLKALEGRTCDAAAAQRAATRIRDPGYSCKNFFDDICAGFPELQLYCVVGPDGLGTSSGRTADDEYQRTIGALFAIFWLMRMDGLGKESFCYGLNFEWEPLLNSDAKNRAAEEKAKRNAFYATCDWTSLERLMMDSGMLIKANGKLSHNVERTLAMLVLMAIHDIMKMSVLLPTVDAKVKDFHGYKAGETVSDHDVALSYVLVHHPEALPSMQLLNKAQKDAVKFTHCKLDYNMGWLVQAEAPPGALFRTFKKVIVSGRTKAEDIAFYFVHWFADLAGAEPCPLEGCDKFVLKFPLGVLRSFLESFSIVQTLATAKTETQVFEDYLVERWQKHEPSLGPPPTGAGSICKMRLQLMAQGGTEQLLKHFAELPPDQQDTLCFEMALTGRAGQRYQRDALNGCFGPAFLVYYAPALLQKDAKKYPRTALLVLAEVLRTARELWPLSDTEADETVTVRIDSLKELGCSAAFYPDPGYHWILCRNSATDGVVKLQSVSSIKHIDWSTTRFLGFGAENTSMSKEGALGITPDKIRLNSIRGGLVVGRRPSSEERRKGVLSLFPGLRRLHSIMR